MAATYTVTDITKWTEYDPAGGVATGTEVAFTTVPSGIAWSVRLPSLEPTAAEVDAAIGPEVPRLEAIKAL